MPGEPTPTCVSCAGSTPGLGGRLAQRGDDRRRDVGGAARRRRRAARLPEHGVLLVDHDGLDLRAAEVDAAAQHRASLASCAARSAAEDRAEQVALEGLRSRDEVHAGEVAVRAHVVELAGEIPNAVGGGKRRQHERAEHADRLAGGVHEAAARVARDTRGDRQHRAAPATAGDLDDGALLRAELRDAEAQLRVAVRVDRESRPATVPRRVGSTEPRNAGIDAAGVGRVEAHEREVVVLTGVRVALVQRLHRQPGVVDERARAARAGHRDGGPERKRLARATVRRECPADAGAMGGLADVRARRVAEDEVRRALSAVGERLHAGMDRGRGSGGGAGGRDERADDAEQGGTGKALLHGCCLRASSGCMARGPYRTRREL